VAEKVRHVVPHGRPGGKVLWYWQPSPSLRAIGFQTRRLPDDPAERARTAGLWNAEADRERAKAATGGPIHAPGTLDALIRDYEQHDDYKMLAASTRYRYGQCLRIIGGKWGELRTRAITPAAVQALKRGMRATPGQANSVLRVLRALFSFGIREGIVAGTHADNPCRDFRQFRERPREQLWSHDEEGRFLTHASPEMALAYLVGVYTAQREGDVLRLPWGAYDGETITLRQGKTGRRLELPVAARLRLALDAAPRRSTIILTRADGQPWKARTFRDAFAVARDAAGVTDRRFQDLRRTAVVRLAEAGCTVPEIASVTGHDIDYCQRIIDTYLPRTRKLALAAIEKLERKR
jgi:integrase